MPLFEPPGLGYVASAVVELGSPLEGRQRVVSITSTGVRTGPPEVLAALARGERVDRSRYRFQLAIRASTSGERQLWLNTAILVASAERTPDTVRYDLYRLT